MWAVGGFLERAGRGLVHGRSGEVGRFRRREGIGCTESVKQGNDSKRAGEKAADYRDLGGFRREVGGFVGIGLGGMFGCGEGAVGRSQE